MAKILKIKYTSISIPMENFNYYVSFFISFNIYYNILACKMSSYDKRSQIMKLKRRKRTSAKKEFDEAKEINVAVKTGKVLIGTNKVLSELAMGSLQLIIVANNMPRTILDHIEALNLCLKNPVPIYTAHSTSYDLGATCGKPFWIGTIGIIEPGDSAIMKSIEK
jgi:large subunit ribosomal protein L30e